MSIANIRPANVSGRKHRKRRIWEFRYPRLCNWLIFSRLADGRWDVFDDVRKKHFLLDGRTVRYIRRLDGKRNPFCISRVFTPDEVRAILQFLWENHLLRKSRLVGVFPHGQDVSVWIPSRITGKSRFVSYCLNLFLILSFFPVFAIGLRMYLRSPMAVSGFSFGGWLFGLTLGLFTHEIAHAVACLAYGGHLFELGVTLGLLQGGGYTMMETQHIRSRAKKAQISAAGTESDLLLCGVFLALGAASPILKNFCAAAAIVNFATAIFNSALLPGLDGSLIWSELTGTDEPFKQLMDFILHPKVREETLQGDIRRKLTFLISNIAFLASTVLMVKIISRFITLIEG